MGRPAELPSLLKSPPSETRREWHWNCQLRGEGLPVQGPAPAQPPGLLKSPRTETRREWHWSLELRKGAVSRKCCPVPAVCRARGFRTELRTDQGSGVFWRIKFTRAELPWPPPATAATTSHRGFPWSGSRPPCAAWGDCVSPEPF